MPPASSAPYVPQAVTVNPNGSVSAAPPSRGPAPDVSMREDGSIAGVDVILRQVSGALAQEAIPVIRREILPVLQQDHQLQRRVGYAAGTAAGQVLARKLWPYMAVLTVAALVATGVSVKRYLDDRKKNAAADTKKRSTREERLDEAA